MLARKILSAVAIGTMVTALQATAVLYTPVYLSPPSPVPQASNPTIADVAAALGVSVASVGSQLYKYTPSTATEDVGASLFNTVLSLTPPPTGEQTLTISYTGGSPAPLLSYIVVKDGAAGWTVWAASGWNGSDDIQVDNRDLWNPPHNALSGISHVSIYGGTRPPTTRVPDGASTAALLGVSLLGVRRFAKGLRA